MSWYLTITPSEEQGPVSTGKLLSFLESLSELQKTGPVSFGAAPGQPWVHVILAKIGASGGYSSDGSLIPEIDIVELVCSDERNAAWYDSMASRIAAFLGWVAVDEHEQRQVWPPQTARRDEFER